MGPEEARLGQALRDAASAPAGGRLGLSKILYTKSIEESLEELDDISQHSSKLVASNPLPQQQLWQTNNMFFMPAKPTDLDLRYLRDHSIEYRLESDGTIGRIRIQDFDLYQTHTQHEILAHLNKTKPQWLAPAALRDIQFLMQMPLRIREKKKETMLAKILRLYKATMTGDVRSPLVHIVGPPGCGKSTSVEHAAELMGVKLHIINVSRMSPLDIEGVQMPTDNNSRLAMLTATWWTQLNDGDIVLFDEFLRGFPEVYNGLLDILTSRRVGAFELPKVFFIAASNSVATYDKALEDRLLHLFVDDPRKSKPTRQYLAKLIVDACGLHPDMEKNFAMEQLIEQEVLPMYEMLDAFKGKAVGAAAVKGHSVRNLIGQVRMREIQSVPLRELIETNNQHAVGRSQWQFVVLPDGGSATKYPAYEVRARGLVGNDKLTEIQVQNLELNLELIELEAAMKEGVL